MRSVMAGIAAALLLVTACASSENGTPAADSSRPIATAEPATPEPVEGFDPCRDIPDDALAATGVDPATESSDVSGVEFTGWKVCGWEAPWYFLTVYLGEIGMDLAVLQNRQFTGFEPVTAAGRDAVRFTSTIDEPGASCLIAFPTQFGAVIFDVSARYLIPRPEDTCTVVERHLNDLIVFMP